MYSITKLLAAAAIHDPHDETIGDLQEENDYLRRLLAATFISYNATKKWLNIYNEFGHKKIAHCAP